MLMSTISLYPASLIDEFVPGQMITGTGADIIFKIPVMRQIMAWIGTMPAKRKNITKTFEKGSRIFSSFLDLCTGLLFHFK